MSTSPRESFEILSGKNYFALFDLPPQEELDANALRKKYRKKALVYHPDKCRNLPQSEQDECEKIFKLYDAAYKGLSDPQTRINHLRLLFPSSVPEEKKKRKAPPVVPFSEFQNIIADEKSRKKNAEKIAAFIRENPRLSIDSHSISAPNVFFSLLEDANFEHSVIIYQAIIDQNFKKREFAPEMILKDINPFTLIFKTKDWDSRFQKTSTIIDLFSSYYEPDLARNKIITLLENALLPLNNSYYAAATKTLNSIFSIEGSFFDREKRVKFNSPILAAISRTAETRFNATCTNPEKQRDFRLYELLNIRKDIWDKKDLDNSKSFFKDLMNFALTASSEQEKKLTDFLVKFMLFLNKKEEGRSLKRFYHYFSETLSRCSAPNKKKLLDLIGSRISDVTLQITLHHPSVPFSGEKFKILHDKICQEQCATPSITTPLSGATKPESNTTVGAPTTPSFRDSKELPAGTYFSSLPTFPISSSNFFSHNVKSTMPVPETKLKSTPAPLAGTPDLELSIGQIADALKLPVDGLDFSELDTLTENEINLPPI